MGKKSDEEGKALGGALGEHSEGVLGIKDWRNSKRLMGPKKDWKGFLLIIIVYIYIQVAQEYVRSTSIYCWRHGAGSWLQ